VDGDQACRPNDDGDPGGAFPIIRLIVEQRTPAFSALKDRLAAPGGGDAGRL